MNTKAKQIEPQLSRREWLDRAVQFFVAGALSVAATGCQKRALVVCSDPARLSNAENSLRESLRYTEESPQNDQTCGDCGFFAVSAEKGCGTCKLLKGPVNPMGRCNSWSAAKR